MSSRVLGIAAAATALTAALVAPAAVQAQTIRYQDNSLYSLATSVNYNSTMPYQLKGSSYLFPSFNGQQINVYVRAWQTLAQVPASWAPMYIRIRVNRPGSIISPYTSPWVQVSTTATTYYWYTYINSGDSIILETYGGTRDAINTSPYWVYINNDTFQITW